MKIGQPSAPILPNPSTAQKPADGTKRATDTTTLSSGIGAARQSVENTRIARVQEIASQITKGSYTPNAQAIADAILDEAMIDAQLEAG